MRSRAGIVVTGTEVLTGRVADRNGPWLVEQLRELGVDIAQVIVVGDRPDDLRDALRFFADAGVDLVITTGGLGPDRRRPDRRRRRRVPGPPVRARPRARDADRRDRRAAQRRPRLAHRPGGHRGRRPQAGAGAARRGRARAGRAPRPGWSCRRPTGSDAPAGRWCCPGPPRELQGMWPAALADPTVQAALRGRRRAAAGARSGCGACRSPSWPRCCATTTRRAGRRWRSPPACATASSRSSPGSRPDAEPAYRELEAADRRGVRRHAVLGRRPDGRRDRGRRAARPRADDRHRGVVHRRSARRAAHRAGGLVGLRPRRLGRLLERGQDRAGRRPGRAHRARRRGERRGGRSAGARRPGAARRRRRGRASPGSPGRTAAAPTSRSGWCTCAWPTARPRSRAASCCRARAPTSVTGRWCWPCTCCGSC